MTQFLSALSVGLGSGAIYALVAIGFVMIFKSTGVISFAQPAFLMSGAIIVSFLAPLMGFYVGAILGVIAIGVIALLVERLTIRPMIGKAVFIVAIITVGLDIVLRTIAGMFLGAQPRSVGDPWGTDVSVIAGVVIQHRHVAAFVTAAVIVIALLLFFRYSSVGLAMRAVASDQEAAMVQGVSASLIFALSWAMAGTMAAIAGIFAATGGPIGNQLWLVALIALPAIVIGGFDSIGGAIIGGLTIGVAQAVVSTYHDQWFDGSGLLPDLTTNLGPLVPWIIMLAVLLVRPHGLLGTKEVERV